jgi:hypothetical protein
VVTALAVMLAAVIQHNSMIASRHYLMIYQLSVSSCQDSEDPPESFSLPPMIVRIFHNDCGVSVQQFSTLLSSTA